MEEEKKIKFGNEPEVFNVKDISVKDFNNKIWRSGFIYGMMAGSALVMLIFAVIVSPIIYGG